MTILFAKNRHILGAGQIRSGLAARPHTVRIERGLVWLTVEGQARDHWLEAGAALVVEPGLLVVIEAHLDSSIALEPRPAACPAEPVNFVEKGYPCFTDTKKAAIGKPFRA